MRPLTWLGSVVLSVAGCAGAGSTDAAARGPADTTTPPIDAAPPDDVVAAVDRRAPDPPDTGPADVGGADGAPTSDATPPDPCSASTGTAVPVETASDLVSALAAAVPGTKIVLANGTYAGNFTAAALGTAAEPVAVCGSRAAVLDGGNTSTGYVLHVTGTYWTLSGFTVQNGGKGIVLDGASHVRLAGLLVTNIGTEGVHFRTSSTDNVLIDSEVRGTGKVTPGYGEGVYLGSAVSNWTSIMGSASTPDKSDNNRVEHNAISDTAAECVDIKEGSTGGVLVNNTFDGAGISGQNSATSWVNVKGNGYTLTGNKGVHPSANMTNGLSLHVIPTPLAGVSGNDNTFGGNALDLTGLPASAVGIWLDANGQRNVVHCDNTVTPSTYPLLRSGSICVP